MDSVLLIRSLTWKRLHSALCHGNSCRPIDSSCWLRFYQPKMNVHWHIIMLKSPPWYACCESGQMSTSHRILAALKSSISHWLPQLPLPWGFTRASMVAQLVKNLPAMQEPGFSPWSGRSPGHGNPLQNSCLGNPMDRGAWWATVHGVTKSRTWLSD